MTFKKIGSRLDDAGEIYSVDETLCKRVSLDYELFDVEPIEGEFLVPITRDIKRYVLPDFAYKVLDQWHEGGKKAIEIKKKGLVRDLVLELFYEEFYKGFGITSEDIERYYSEE